jgi:hypothetical protein
VSSCALLTETRGREGHLPGPVLRRACSCGTHVVGGGECERCKAAPPIVDDVLRSPGEPIDPVVRSTMARRFGRDFGSVRVHTGPTAADSARAVDAFAYTVGTSVVFGPEREALRTPAGRSLLSHELTHVLQDEGRPRQGPVTIAGPDGDEERAAERNEQLDRRAVVPAQGVPALRRKGGTAGGFFRNIGREIVDIFTRSEPDYDPATLDVYLKYLRKQNDIEDDWDSDNKARAVVKKGLFKPETLRVRILLIEEMMSGAVLGDDEQAILKIIEAAPVAERNQIADTVGYRRFYDAFDGAELDQLYELLPMLHNIEPRGEEKVTAYTMDQFIAKWEKEHGRAMTPAERRVLARGCIGITELNLGTLTRPDLSSCYGTFEAAWAAQRKMKDFLTANFPDRKAVIFSARFWAGGQDYTPDPKTGKVDLSTWNLSASRGEGYTNFDFGFWDEEANTWWHADHCDETVLGSICAGEGRMTVYESNLKQYSRPLSDFDVQVFCVGISTLK